MCKREFALPREDVFLGSAHCCANVMDVSDMDNLDNNVSCKPLSF